MFRSSPVSRARYEGFLRNVVVAIANTGSPRFVPALERLAQHSSGLVRAHACWALDTLSETASRGNLDIQH